MKAKFLKKLLALSMALAVTAGAACSTAAVTSAAEADITALTAVQELTNESTISAGAISLGKSVTIHAKASGGTGGYTYTVIYKKKSSSNWTVKQKLSENTKVVITPAAQTDYKICVKAQDSSGQVVNKYFTLKVKPELQNNSVISKTTVIYGESLKVYGRAEGGVGTRTYAVLYKKASDTKWTVKQDYSTNTKVSIIPSKAVKYNVCVKVKDEEGTVVKKYFDFNVKLDEVKEVFRLTNEERQKVGAGALQPDDRLMAVAQKRAEEIVTEFSHTRPNGTDCFTILDEYNILYWGAGENIAHGYSTPASVMKGWMNSEGHRENILDSYFTHMGVGLYQKGSTKYWVQIFAKLR